MSVGMCLRYAKVQAGDVLTSVLDVDEASGQNRACMNSTQNSGKGNPITFI